MWHSLRERIAASRLRLTLKRRFRVGDAFLNDYLNRFSAGQRISLKGLEDLDRLSPTQQMWFYYALSTNCRGDELANEVARYTDWSGKRYLDIGCGFGGCLRAGAQREAECVGVELEDVRIALAKLNLADANLNGKVQVLSQDVLDPNVSQTLGTFDILTCNDVAEHVLDPALLFQRMRELSRPGAVVYLEVPNRYSLNFVRSDGHFGLFGITLLERPEAMRYHSAHLGGSYDVGEYLLLNEYSDLFRTNGFEPELIPSLYHPAGELSEVEDKLKLSDAARDAFADPADELRSAVCTAYEAYRTEILADYEKAKTDKQLENEFRTTYLRDFWTFVAKRID